MFSVTPETHALLCLLIMTAAFLIAQIMTHPDSTPTEPDEQAAASRPITLP